jgi:hypothetical protein
LQVIAAMVDSAGQSDVADSVPRTMLPTGQNPFSAAVGSNLAAAQAVSGVASVGPIGNLIIDAILAVIALVCPECIPFEPIIRQVLEVLFDTIEQAVTFLVDLIPTPKELLDKVSAAAYLAFAVPSLVVSIPYQLLTFQVGAIATSFTNIGKAIMTILGIPIPSAVATLSSPRVAEDIIGVVSTTPAELASVPSDVHELDASSKTATAVDPATGLDEAAADGAVSGEKPSVEEPLAETVDDEVGDATTTKADSPSDSGQVVDPDGQERGIADGQADGDRAPSPGDDDAATDTDGGDDANDTVGAAKNSSSQKDGDATNSDADRDAKPSDGSSGAP